MLNLSTRLDTIHGIGPRFLSRLKALKIETVGDLLAHFPSRYEDFSQIYRITDLEPGQHATVQGTVQDIDVRRTWQKRLTIVEATIVDETGAIRAIWFNQPYIKNALRPGQLANFSGKVSFSEQDHDVYLSHPTYELVGHYETKHTGRLVPIYPETRGLTSKGIRFIMQPLIENIEPISEWLPEEVIEAESLQEINAAIKNIHFPQTVEDALVAKKRFAFEDLFLLQLLNAEQKSRLANERAPQIPTDIELTKALLTELPFPLTQSQKQSLWEVIQDVEKPRPMNRLLQGDVGSGKTVVAALAALLAAKQGLQTTIMAPTEVLANQHFGTFKKLFGGIRSVNQPRTALLTAAGAKVFYDTDLEETVTKSVLQKKIASGEVQIVMGTHALIQSAVSFNNLGLVIIDEQHRFGVDQRAKLLKKTGQQTIPHFLSMSATPIPRTLMLTIFGDLDISTITELPQGRKNIVTKVIDAENRPSAYGFIRTEIKKGRQAFVICPRIEKAEESEKPGTLNFIKAEMKSVKEEYEKLSKIVFPDLKVAMLHGQLKSKEKEMIMKDFREGATDVLVSTSVIEVGVDVPNATIMMIEGSDRFGLAQLYQFRGRVGRGEYQSYCFLFTDASTGTSKERLKAITEAKNGFELAERDLKIRGPGEFWGQKQTGLPDIAMANLQNIELIKTSRGSAHVLLARDPHLKGYPLLRQKLAEFRARIHLE